VPYINQFNCCGRLTGSPKLEPEKKERVNFTIALNKPGRRAYYIDCVVWGPRAKILAAAGNKGDQLFLSGEIETNTYQDERGSWHRGVVLRVEDFSILRGESPAPVQKLKPPI